MKSYPRLDFHVHLAGLGNNGTRNFISSGTLRSLLFVILRMQLGILSSHRKNRFDADYARKLLTDFTRAQSAGFLDGLLVFAHDQVFMDDGSVSGCQELFVPNSYVFLFCERHRSQGLFLPVMSVHPYRLHARKQTEYWIQKGAAAMKWLPNSQNIDPGDKRSEAIFEILEHFKIPLIVHSGGEHTVTNIRPKFGDPRLFRRALRRGCNVIFAHCGTSSGFLDFNWLNDFAALVKEFPNAWGDTSALCSLGRTRWIGGLLSDSDVAVKLIHGSDYPIPPICLPFFRNGPGFKKALELQAVSSLFARDVAIKREWGFPESHFSKGWELIPESAKKGIVAGNWKKSKPSNF
ncbi:amidohydrolase family protein [bacterium]|nr:amidohydrolase family protein [bacterium]